MSTTSGIDVARKHGFTFVIQLIASDSKAKQTIVRLEIGETAPDS